MKTYEELCEQYKKLLDDNMTQSEDYEFMEDLNQYIKEHLDEDDNSYTWYTPRQMRHVAQFCYNSLPK